MSLVRKIIRRAAAVLLSAALLLTDLDKAEKFIFLEFFILRSGKMWDGVEPVSYTHLDVYKRQGWDCSVP